jgi:hypothetical protein
LRAAAWFLRAGSSRSHLKEDITNAENRLQERFANLLDHSLVGPDAPRAEMVHAALMCAAVGGRGLVQAEGGAPMLDDVLAYLQAGPRGFRSTGTDHFVRRYRTLSADRPAAFAQLPSPLPSSTV